MLEVGTRVIIERDEEKYPSKGTWPRYKGKEGTIVRINYEKFDSDRKQTPNLKWRGESIEYGVAFGLKKNATKTQIQNGRFDAWFLPHEIRAI